MDSAGGAAQGHEAQFVTAAIDPSDQYLLGGASASDRRGLERYLAKPVRERSADEVARIVDRMDVHRSAEFAADYGHGIADAAHNALGVALAACRLHTTSP